MGLGIMQNKKSKYMLLLDSETTIDGKVFDLAFIVTDRKGNIIEQYSYIVNDYINSDLFYCRDNEHFSKANAEKKKQAYYKMLDNGDRTLASVNAINSVLQNIVVRYKSVCLTAYNLNFDFNACKQSGIDLAIFDDSFCLWHSAFSNFADKAKYKRWALKNHYIGTVTSKGNCTIQTNAEVMAHYITGEYKPEPHTALEDILYFELPILKQLLKKRTFEYYPYNWRLMQLRDAI